ncbi:unnamed protein product [Dibothriocephalus latus]|uniref:Uncharacterized protein n=1 Tax=Dibothriocephalus latus TaxID=60516 RepID=A0A3P7NPK6_DIBLA|nr:unnamed protein product [Dibothriocephalus latus]
MLAAAAAAGVHTTVVGETLRVTNDTIPALNQPTDRQNDDRETGTGR